MSDLKNIKSNVPQCALGHKKSIDITSPTIRTDKKKCNKIWKAIFRDKQGSRKHIVVEAIDRAEALCELSKRGIMAIRLEELSDDKSVSLPHISFKWVASTVAICFLVLVVLGWLVFNSKTSKEEIRKEKKHGAIIEVKPSISTNRVENVNPKEENGIRYTRKGTRINVPQNPFGTPIPKDLEYKPFWEYTEEDCARVDPGYAARHERFLERESNRTFHTGVDRNLAVALFSEPGQPSLLIPFSINFKDQFLKSLETPIIVSKDDPPEIQAQKRQMIETKIWLKEQLDDGQDIVAILNEEVARQSKIRTLRENLLKELHDLRRNNVSRDELQDYVDAANLMLEDAGGAKVSIPMIDKKKMYLNPDL